MEKAQFEQVAMIGNSMGDFIGHDIALHYAVSNASKEFKDKAIYVANLPLTSGVMEIITKITDKI